MAKRLGTLSGNGRTATLDVDPALLAIGGVVLGTAGWLAWKHIRRDRSVQSATSAVFVILPDGRAVPQAPTSAGAEDDGPPGFGPGGSNAQKFSTLIAQRASTTNFLVPDEGPPLGLRALQRNRPSRPGWVAGSDPSLDDDPVAEEAAVYGLTLMGYDHLGAILIDTDGKRVQI